MDNKCIVHDCQADTIKDLEKRVRTVEALQLAYNEKFIILFQKLDDVVSMIKKLIGGIALIGVGFIIWYIQSIGGR